jgi:hypothetical protein
VRFSVPELRYERTAALTALEAATMRFALHRAGVGPLEAEDRDRVHEALRKLGRDVAID